jgi:ATP-dependent Lhr-like helicase
MSKIGNSRERTEAPVAENDALDWAHPLVQEWFLSRFGSPTEPQIAGWPAIAQGKATLISAPTGSGKTLTAFLVCIDSLVRKALSNQLESKTEVVYISPLKALSNDIQQNLDGPLAEIRQLAEEKGLEMMPIRTAVRTGDTLMPERRAMLKSPPHILVTTPESFYILITADKSREALRDVRTMIVDEIHAVADDKRGAHLAISLERMDRLANKIPQRIGLSATQKPLEDIARFLTGNNRPMPTIVNVGHKRKLDIAVEVPGMPLGAVATNEQWDETYDRLAKLVNEHRSTLIFVNTRKLAERLTMHLAERLGEDSVAAHHGSLSRKLRHAAERKLKAGQLQALVATASLELGIDIGAIDLVCQISSPRSIAVALQRIGRAGHWRGAIPKGRIFPTTRDELIECAALVRAIKEGELDRIIIPECPMDILSQQIVAMCACEDWNEDELYSVLTKAAPYATLSRQEYNKVLDMLSEGISARRGRYSAYLLWDRVNGILKGRRGARLAAITSGGAIPETALYTVLAEPDQATVGTLDEDFAVESNRGDIVLLGNTSWRIKRIESASGRVIVEDAHGAPPTVPFWLGEAPARSVELSHYVSEMRKHISEIIPSTLSLSETFDTHTLLNSLPEAKQTLINDYGLDESGAEQATEYVLQGRAVLGTVPSNDTIIAERFFDEGGGMQLIIHSPFGGRINKAWGLALRKCFCRSFNFELQAAATDDGLNISLGEQHSFPLSDVFNFLHPSSAHHILEQASLASPIFGTRFRWDATRSLALLRFQGGKKVPPHLMRLKSDDLLAAVFPDAAACQDNMPGDIELPDHPLINEVMKDVLTEAMDLDGLIAVLNKIITGEIKTISVDTPVPSVFSHEILNANPYAYLDDAPLEERRARAVEMRRMLPEALQSVGLLDQDVIRQVSEEAWPDIRDYDELHDLMQTLIALPESFVLKNPINSDKNLADKWQEYFAELSKENRAAIARVATGKTTQAFWVAAEKRSAFDQIYPNAEYDKDLPSVGRVESVREDALNAMLKGWTQHMGPTTAVELAALFCLPIRELETALIRLESSGNVLRGQFRTDTSITEQAIAKVAASGIDKISKDATDRAQNNSLFLEWCDRRLLARIHRMTVSVLRKGIEPVTAAQYMNWLMNWQHMLPGSQLPGDERGTLEIIRQLQGFEIPANAREQYILPRRLKNYNPKVLDTLCLTGAIGWGRLSPHPATLDDGDTKKRRVMPTSVAPIAFFVRDDSDWMSPKHPGSLDENKGLSTQAIEVRDLLKQRGASFFADIVRGTDRLKSEVETALWELVAAGIVTADGFDNLRSLIDPKRRSGQGNSRMQRPRNSTGRWSLLYIDEVDRNKELEAICRVLLKRYGVVFRDVLTRESMLPRWRDLLLTFRRMEDRGEIRGGRFVTGFLGEQFALPEAVESLRASRNRPLDGQCITFSAADPLNLIGTIIPGEKTAATSGNTVSILNGAEFTATEKHWRLA